MAVPCEHGNEPSGVIKSCKFVCKLSKGTLHHGVSVFVKPFLFLFAVICWY
jgi:hypothetical protein